jgi:hypothetical protein
MLVSKSHTGSSIGNEVTRQNKYLTVPFYSPLFIHSSIKMFILYISLKLVHSLR